MALNNEVDRERRSKSQGETAEATEGAPRASRRRRGQTGEYGSALRSVYQTTVQEEIPSEMLDLLGKLG